MKRILAFTANDPNKPDTAYEEYVQLQIHKTTDGGDHWRLAMTGIEQDPKIEPRLVIAPFVMDPKLPDASLCGSPCLRGARGAEL